MQSKGGHYKFILISCITSKMIKIRNPACLVFLSQKLISANKGGGAQITKIELLLFMDSP